MARKAFAVNEAMSEKVRYLAGLGVSQDDIANIIGCAPKTLRKRFRDELDLGMAEGIATIAGCLFLAAKAGNVTVQIFLMKTRAHWRERTSPDPVPSTDAETNSRAVVVLPNNNRDPELTRVLQEAQEKYFAGKKRPPSSQITT